MLYVISMFYICIRAKKIQANPEKSPTYELDQEHRANIVEEEDIVLNTQQKIAAAFAIGSFVTMVFGILKFGWDLPQMSGIMILLGIAGLRFGSGSAHDCTHRTGNSCTDHDPANAAFGLCHRQTVWRVRFGSTLA